MPKYILTYHMDYNKKKALDPEIGKTGQQKFMEWSQSIKKITFFPNTPCMKTKTVIDGSVTDGGGQNSMMGFTIIEADDIDSAVEIARNCPHQEMMGPVQIAECGKMPG